MSPEKFNQPKQEEPDNSDLLKNSALVAGVVAASLGAMELKDMANQGIEDQKSSSHAMMRTPLANPDSISDAVKSSIEDYRKNPDQPLVVVIPHAEMAEAQKHVNMVEGAGNETIHIDLNEKPIHIDKIEH